MKFRIKSTECEIELDWVQQRENIGDKINQTGKALPNPIYHFKYTNRPGKNSFTVYSEHIERNLSFEVWIKL